MWVVCLSLVFDVFIGYKYVFYVKFIKFFDKRELGFLESGSF